MEEKTFALRLLGVAQGFAGESRRNDRAQITKFLNLFDLPFADPQTGRPFAFCAAGASYAACKAWAFSHQPPLATDLESLKTYKRDIAARFFLPSPRCSEIIADPEKRGTWHGGQGDLSAIQPGNLVFFDWNGDGHADHVEIVESSGYRKGKRTGSLRTVGFNTSDADPSDGGAVARKARDRTHVFGFISV